MDAPYRARRAAGRILARHLGGRLPAPLLLALPRGGVPVAYEVAQSLHAELDVLVVRKLGHPDAPELALGAIASGGALVLNEDLMRELGIGASRLSGEIAAQRLELARREAAYRGERPMPPVRGRLVILIDDGLATGATMRVAVQALRTLGAAPIIAAAPVGAMEACALVAREADGMICPLQPEPFGSVGAWYEDFPQTTDDEVRDLLAQAAAWRPDRGHAAGRP